MIKLVRYIILLSLTLNISQVHAMGLLDFFTIHVFSEVTGVVTLNGTPVEGAEIIRTADHEHDKVYTDSTNTDKEGRFYLKGITTFSFRPIMLGTIIRQKMIIKYNGMDYLAWETIKMNNYQYGELNDEGVTVPKKINISCELTEDQDKYEVIELELGNRRVTGICSWNSI